MTTILECRRIKDIPRKGTFMVEDFKPVARQIAGQKYETNFITAEFLTCITSDQVQVIICAKPRGNQEGLPVFVLIRYKGRDIFFLSSFKVLQNLKRNSSPLFQGNLLEALPFLMFLRYACGERCWAGH